MNQTHIHLLLNHVAILGSVFSIVLLIAGMVLKSDVLKKTAMIGFVIAALVAIPVFLTGEPAEESVENIAGTIKATIEEHEESAEISIWLVEFMGAVSLLTFFLAKKSNTINKGLLSFLLLLSIVAAGSISYTGFLGGKIRHTELSGLNTNATGQPDKAAEEDDD
ncbi:MAG: hypothetical protein IPJ66_04785 [Bacteroidetes bacterium]|nr:hypothetical protein [Bacteroidota bacterium]MBL0066379.1 hypothetical protein [Bacteroidota bacterium]MBL0138970.1 hypothetical protein [Bacteroidota bacterium]